MINRESDDRLYRVRSEGQPRVAAYDLYYNYFFNLFSFVRNPPPSPPKKCSKFLECLEAISRRGSGQKPVPIFFYRRRIWSNLVIKFGPNLVINFSHLVIKFDGSELAVNWQ